MIALHTVIVKTRKMHHFRPKMQVFSVDFFIYDKFSFFSLISGHKNGQTFAIIVRKGDYDYA